MLHVTWFKNFHEQRNYTLRFGLMCLHEAGEVRYQEKPLADCVTFGFSAEVASHIHRHTSVISIENHGRRINCIVDSEDSFYWMSPLITKCDIYFCSGYSRAFFEGHEFPKPYAWQTESEISFYREKSHALIDMFGDYFPRVRRFIPIGPSMERRSPISHLAQRFRNLHHKVRSRHRQNLPWFFEYRDFYTRYQELLGYRRLPLAYDIVLSDTLWGWPRHRLGLHKKLQSLACNHAVHARLNWSDLMACDGGTQNPISRSEFPIMCGKIDDYERMMAMSRLALFAAGFHWGWRSIMSLALLIGLPVYADRMILEAWFDINRFHIFWNDTNEWPRIEELLEMINPSEWARIKLHNQSMYDEFMAPMNVARYFLKTAAS